MKRNNLFLFLTTLCLTVASAYAAPDFDPKDPPEPGYYRVTLSVNDALMGSVAGAGDYLDGASVTLTATPNSGYVFLKWSDDSTDNPRDFVLTADLVLTAVFQVEVDAGNLSVCLGYNSFTVLNNPYAADIVLHDKTNAHSTTVTRTATPQVVDIPDEWPEGQYIVEFDDGTHAFIVTKK